MGMLTSGGLSINRRQLFNSVGELSSSELAERDGIFWIFAISQLQRVGERWKIIKWQLKKMCQSYWFSIIFADNTYGVLVFAFVNCKCGGRWWFAELFCWCWWMSWWWLWWWWWRWWSGALAVVARSIRKLIFCMPLDFCSSFDWMDFFTLFVVLNLFRLLLALLMSNWFNPYKIE